MINVQEILSSITPMVLNKNDIVFREGDPPERSMFFIFTGEISLTKISADKREHTIRVLKTGEFFGEMGLVNNISRALTARVLSPIAKLGVMNKEAFYKIAETNPKFLFGLLSLQIERLSNAEEKIAKLLTMKSSRDSMGEDEAGTPPPEKSAQEEMPESPGVKPEGGE